MLGVKTEDGALLIKCRKLTAFSTGEEENHAKADVPCMLADALVAQGPDEEAEFRIGRSAGGRGQDERGFFLLPIRLPPVAVSSDKVCFTVEGGVAAVLVRSREINLSTASFMLLTNSLSSS